MTGRGDGKGLKIGIYVRESRDDQEKKLETIETQRDLLLEHVQRKKLGVVARVYMDDNISGSSFDRDGLNQLREDAEARRLDAVLVKDLSRLGRSNSKTLLFLDFLEENGVRVMTYDDRYDSLRDDDMVGIETWANERYVRDISRKIRASLRYKIERGEYIGHAPYGYRKMAAVKNRLEADPEKAGNVRMIFQLYKKGYGYASIANLFNSRGIPAPSGPKWSGTAVRRILCNSVYTGETVQGVSERISFKSRKARRLPAEKTVVTPGTHEPLVSREEFLEAQELRIARQSFSGPHKSNIHIFRGLVYCGRCKSAMYARNRPGKGLAYVCGNYFRNGSSACSSHLVYEEELLEEIKGELEELLTAPEQAGLAAAGFEKYCSPGSDPEAKLELLEKQLAQKKRQKELAYLDRLEGKIDLQLYEKISKGIEEKITSLEGEIHRINKERSQKRHFSLSPESLLEGDPDGYFTNELARCIVSRIMVFDKGDEYRFSEEGREAGPLENGLLVFEYRSSFPQEMK